MMKNEIVCGDSFDVLQKIENDSIDACVTDPPYFIHGLDNKLWDTTIKSTKNSTIKSLSSGMKFDKEQGKQFYDWYVKICKEILRVLKPGSFFFSFSSPRLHHRMACAVEDAGFLIKDQFIWLYVKSQPKAMSLNHVIDRLKIPDSEKESLKDDLSGWKTPEFEALDKILTSLSPEISFLKYKAIINACVKIDDRTENEYYGNYTTFRTKKVVLRDLYEKMQELSLI